ncbi:hypothetical protein ACFVH6_42610 [Spirillospora sp. NPDC127200]
MELPHAEAVWTEAVTLAVLAEATPELSGLGFDPYPGGLRREDVGNGWWGMAWIEGGRAVLFGYDVDHSDTRDRHPPLDLLAGGPDWLPWEWLDEVMRDAETLAYVYWWDGSSWSRTPYPEGMRDGLAYGADDVEDSFFERADGDRWSEVSGVLARLSSAVAGGAVDRAVLEPVVDLLEEGGDVEAALTMAAALGATPGSTRPRIAAGRGEPADRRVHLIDHDHVASAIGVAMRAASELERPAPVPGPALERAAEWLRGSGDTAVTVARAGSRTLAGAYIASTGKWLDADAAELLQAWRDEDDAEQGRWLYARIMLTGDQVTVERAYDHAPPWWEGGPVPTLARMLDSLREEMRARAPQWRPDWAELLDADLSETGAPPELCWRPS